MKKTYFVALAVFAAALFGVRAYAVDDGSSYDTQSGYSHDSSATSSDAMHEGITGQHKMMEGFIMDAKCVTSKETKLAEKEGKLDAFVIDHSKACVLKCGLEGCSFYSEGRLWKLDKDSSKRIEAFLQQPSAGLHVKADVYEVGKDKIGLTNIKSAM